MSKKRAPRLFNEDTPKTKRFVLIEDSLTINLVCNANGDVVDIEYYNNDDEVLDAIEEFLTKKQINRLMDGEIIEVLAELLDITLVKET